MQVKKLILSGLVSAAFLPVLATDWYYVGGSNEWWKAESYSTTKSKTGNTTMPSGTDCIYPTSATQKLYMDDSTVAFLNTIGGVYLNVNGVEFYLNLTTNATVTGYLGDIGGHGYYKNWLIKDGAGTLSFDGTSGSSMYCVKGVREKNFAWKRAPSVTENSADVFGRAYGAQGNVFP